MGDCLSCNEIYINSGDLRDDPSTSNTIESIDSDLSILNVHTIKSTIKLKPGRATTNQIISGHTKSNHNDIRDPSTSNTIESIDSDESTLNLHTIKSTMKLKDGRAATQIKYTYSKLLYSMDKDTLASMIKYILENEVLFEKYRHQTAEVYNAIINYRINGKMVIKLSKNEFINKLPWIRTAITSKLYEHLQSLTNKQIESILDKIRNPVSLSIVTEEKQPMNIEIPDYLTSIDMINTANVEMLNQRQFQIFVYVLCITNKYDKASTDLLVQSLIEMNINGAQFMNMNRLNFYHKLKVYQIKGGIASKLHKLIMSNSQNVDDYINLIQMNKHKKWTAIQLAECGIHEFQISAHKMLQSMNESMKFCMVNGLKLAEHYQSRDDLQVYLKENVRNKSVDILTDMLWNDYMKDKENIIIMIMEFDRGQLLKYFMSLYMNHIKDVMIRNELDADKCMALKKKDVCNIFIKECGFRVGVATNIVEKIYAKINKE